MRKDFEQWDRELQAKLWLTGSVEERERLVVENLRRKEAVVNAERGLDNVVAFRRPE